MGEKTLGWDLGDYVVSEFLEDEIKIFCSKLQDVNSAVETMVKSDIHTAMNKYNGKLRR